MSVLSPSEFARGPWRATLRRANDRLYALLCGEPPNFRPWHFQWLAGRPLYRNLRPVLEALGGDVLDVGCGDKPYEGWMRSAASYFGIDVEPSPRVDRVITPGKPWPLATHRYDVVLCTQVLEHTRDIEVTLAEMTRVLRPGGRLVATVPFIYGEHGSPHDYRRLSRYGITELIGRRLDVLQVLPQGAVGSSLCPMALAWLQAEMTSSFPRRVVWSFCLPAWMAVCLAVNCLGVILDALDHTSLFYSNVLVVATTKGDR
jgi:SAM-dependent methyltransferase